MFARKILYCMVLGLLLFAAAGCNLPTANDSGNQAEVENNGGNIVDVQEPETPTNTPVPPTPEPEISLLPEFDVTDPCSIVPASVAETVLGQAVEPIEGPGTCLYTSGMASITVAVQEGEAAKNALVGLILQLENDCSMSFSYDSEAPDPTPLPPEADQYLSMSMLELMEQSLSLQESCGGQPYETLIDYGPGVYLAPVEIMFPSGQVSIVTEEYVISIVFIDLEQDLAASVEDARQILTLIAEQ